ncbi:helix-turn-helix transcriptional regulator [Phytoactinopolyspora limicola]|uniref:helix-turn-helix transcriptional regulator n=1 Tax=Phytoactinopolyspora limicola TaxID=2715536 RepID=UPI001407E5EC|nr:helix-turn-helix transcriptional regulator [Phytoactinopolyspora limicola]
MARKVVSPLPATSDALGVLGNQVRIARHDRGWTVAELAARVGVSSPTVLAIESGAPGTAIGTVFNAAFLVGVPLFGVEDRAELARMRRRGEEHIALIPSRVQAATSRKAGDDTDDLDF